jgi:membrane-associated protein
MTLAGYYLGGVPLIRKNFEKAVLLIVFVSLLPLLIHYIQSRRATAAVR